MKDSENAYPPNLTEDELDSYFIFSRTEELKKHRKNSHLYYSLKST